MFMADAERYGAIGTHSHVYTAPDGLGHADRCLVALLGLDSPVLELLAPAGEDPVHAGGSEDRAFRYLEVRGCGSSR